METTQKQSVDVLNSFLKDEIAAVETYRQALGKIDPGPARVRLLECLRSHEGRVSTLRTRVQALGGDPADSSGAWGAFMKLFEGGAKLFGEKAAIAALEEGEDHGRDEYKREISRLDSVSRTLVETQIMPEQMRTHQTVSALKHSA